MRKFLTARWENLIMANYEVDPTLLVSRVPVGTELDLHEGRCFVSLVGFMFVNTRVLGLPIPFHINFEEVNLRFYVRRKLPNETRRAVCFIKEIVPRHAIALIARLGYGEPYECWRMSHQITADRVGYRWSRRANNNIISVEIGENLGIPDAGSHGEFIIEHYWGYTKRKGSRVDEYKVEHSKWKLFSVKNAQIEVDFETTYGGDLAFLANAQPYSILLANGSEIAVYKGQRLTN